jgi:hypothetical protein
MIFCNEIIPNIWWIYSNKFEPLTEDEINYINKLTNHHKIEKMIKLDDYCEFWNKSSQFILDIKKQLEMHEITMMKALLSKLYTLIYSNYTVSKPTLLFTNKYNEIGYMCWLYIFRKITENQYKVIMESLNLKLKTKIHMTEKENRFLLLLDK